MRRPTPASTPQSRPYYSSRNPDGFPPDRAQRKQIDFDANGRFVGLYDASLNNGIVAGYNASGQMISLTQQSSGESLAIGYYTTGNGTGLISSVASSDGRTVNYSYDSSGHLTSVKSYDGQTTTYSYDSSSNAAIAKALTAITPPSGPATSFAYSATGQLSVAAVSGGQNQFPQLTPTRPAPAR